MRVGIAEGKKSEEEKEGETKIKQRVGGFHGPLTAERNSKRGYPPACTRQALTRLRVNANFLTR